MSSSGAPKISRSNSSKPSKRRANKRRRRRTPRCSTKCRSSSERRAKTPCWSSPRGVAQRLHALKELIPSIGGNDDDQNAVTTDEIFDGTADYILLLRARVEILKHLVEEFYGTGVVEENAPAS